ncbi:MAG: PAS domain-containing protein [Chloroflexi bacterium]|jgi:signal transduction histidine kinase|nr:PAS domain-containing protein [Chloroflexota bacterium]MBT3669879.1 PAS domain-containing protein [Chloroflexota bacterium]MBT4001700.1 PAS domain-containing protein [Chloroflexota bacterium]MBT4304781.1 PAS domain-containing protein [Chloroflexota bacterium]MBT4534718.1 PAS domain-containing protein [Chloroflexota bacterium]
MDTKFNFQNLLKNAPLIFFVLDEEGKITYLEGKGLNLFDHWDDPIGASVYDLFESDPVAIEMTDRALAGESFISNLVFSGVIWEIRLSPVFSKEGKLDVVVGVIIDVTQSKRSEIENEQLIKALAGSHDRLQNMSNRLFDVQETERRKIAYELHDEIGQSLTGIRLSLELAMRDVEIKNNPYLIEANNLSREVLALVREMSLNLRPAMLDDLGLIPTIRWHFERYRKQTNIQVVFESEIGEERFNSRVETALYRIVQEGLTNVAKHAKVDQVLVKLWKDELGINLEITDNGTGFDLDSEIDSKISSGLSSIQDRVGLLNGKLTIQSEIGKGSGILVSFPKQVLPTEE